MAATEGRPPKLGQDPHARSMMVSGAKCDMENDMLGAEFSHLDLEVMLKERELSSDQYT